MSSLTRGRSYAASTIRVIIAWWRGMIMLGRLRLGATTFERKVTTYERVEIRARDARLSRRAGAGECI